MSEPNWLITPHRLVIAAVLSTLVGGAAIATALWITDSDKGVERIGVAVNVAYTVVTTWLVLATVHFASQGHTFRLQELKQERETSAERKATIQAMVRGEVERISNVRASIEASFKAVLDKADHDWEYYAADAFNVYMRLHRREEFDAALLAPDFLLALSSEQMTHLTELRSITAIDVLAGQKFEEWSKAVVEKKMRPALSNCQAYYAELTRHSKQFAVHRDFLLRELAPHLNQTTSAATAS